MSTRKQPAPKVELSAKGLVLAPGELSRAPGALSVALNVNVDAPGIIRSRQGFAKQANGFGGPAWKFISTKQLGTDLLLNHGTASAASGLRTGDGSALTTRVLDSSGSAAVVINFAEARMQALVGQKNHYLTSTTGMRRLETNNVLFHAGMPKSIGFDTTGPTAILVGGSGGFLGDLVACAYRQTWCKKDQEGIPMEGAPSSRLVIYNLTGTTGYSSGNAQNVTVRVLLPKENGTSGVALTTAYFLRLYRSEAMTTLPQNVTTTDVHTGITTTTPRVISPSDEMTLVYEAYLTAGNISAGYVDITDVTTESFRLSSATQGPLYTNQVLGGDVGPPDAAGNPITGVELANDPPPQAADCVSFAECAFFANLIYRDHFEFSLLSVVDSSGLSVGDTITVTPQFGYTQFVMTAIAPGAPSNNQFVVYTAGSTAQNIERTALNLVEAINKSSTNDSVWASYIPSQDFFGVVRLEARVGGGLTFNVVASAHGAAYRPQLGIAVTATSDRYPNGLAYSKPAQADAVPPVNLLLVGRQDTTLLKQVVLRGALYLFTDAGLYRLDGRTQDNFSISEFDLSFRLIGPELVAVCDDSIYAWGVQGLAQISSAGVVYIHNAIEPLVWQAIQAATLSQLASYGWSVAYQSRHKVAFFFPGSSSAKNCQTAFVYDTRMQAWTTWGFPAGRDADTTTGYACGAVRVSDDLLFMGQWQASGNDTDIYKERRTYAASDYQDDTYDATSQAIVKTLTWAATNESPVLEAHWDELHVLFEVSSTFAAWTTPSAISATFISDFASSSGPLNFTPTALSKRTRISVPRGQRRSNSLVVSVSHSVAAEYFSLEGMSLVPAGWAEGTATVRT